MPDEETLPKEKVCNNRALFNDQQKIAYQLSGIASVPLEQFRMEMRTYAAKDSSVFPHPETIYSRTYYFEKHKAFVVSKSQSPQIHSAKGMLTEHDNSPPHSSIIKSPIELTPKEIRCEPKFDIPSFRLYSVDERTASTSDSPIVLSHKLIRASESRFEFAKTSESDCSHSDTTGIEEMLYQAAKQELLSVATNGSHTEKQQEDESMPEVDHKWLNDLLENDGSSSTHTSPSLSPSKVKAAFDGNDYGGALYPYLACEEDDPSQHGRTDGSESPPLHLKRQQRKNKSKQKRKDEGTN